METSDLMRFDRVMFTTTVDFPNIDKYGIQAICPATVDAVIGDKVVFLKTDDPVIGDDVQATVNDVSPVTLTDEIIEMNGFDNCSDEKTVSLFRQKDDDYGNELYNINVYRYSCDDVYHIEITRYEGGYVYIQKSVSDVHSFQHALREAGLTEIANNFKVK